MKNKNNKKLFFYFCLIFLALPFSAGAYTPISTHIGLTEQTIDFYNFNFNKKINNEDKERIIQGSIDEDNPSQRAINHFYDPVRNMGINNGRTSKEWALNGSLVENDFSWPKIIKYYAEGYEEKAFIGLGHVLHLIQDLAVPEHTRNDPHMGEGFVGLYTDDSPYEKWADKMKNRYTLKNISNDYIYQNFKIKNFSYLGEVFDFLADYSNKNFFSNNTIKNSVYQYAEPVVIKVEGDYGYGIDKLNNEKFKLLIQKNDEYGNLIRTLQFKNDFSIFFEYFSRLSKQAVLSGAGVVDLFFREAIPAREKYLAEQKRKNEEAENKTAELASSLNSKGFFGLVFSGFGFLIEDNIITPISNSFSFVASNISFGFNSIFQPVINYGNIAVFSGKTTAVVGANVVKEEGKVLAGNIKDGVYLAGDFIGKSISNFGTQVDSTQLFAIPASFIPKQNKTGNVKNTTVENVTTEAERQAVLLSLKTASPSVSIFYGGGAGTLVGQNSFFVATASSTVLSEIISAPTTTTPATTALATTVVATSTVTITVSTTTDIIIPESPTISVSECADSLSNNKCLVATTTLNISLTSDVPDFSHFIFEQNGIIETINATNTTSIITTTSALTTATTTTATTTTETIATKSATTTVIFTAEIRIVAKDNLKNNLSVSVMDSAGNISASSTVVVEVSTNPIVINEIAWLGTNSANPNDEWIELYNKTESDILFDDSWVLYSKTDNSPYIKLSGIIPAKGYFLIERKNGNETDEIMQSPIVDIPADMWVSFGAGLNNNSGEVVSLVHASTIIDEVPLCYGKWCGGLSNNGYYYSMERNSPDDPSDERTTWSQRINQIKNGKAVDGGVIYGTPKKRNSYTYLLNEKVSANITLKKENSPYFVRDARVWVYHGNLAIPEPMLTIRSGTTLTVEPGVVIKFGQNAGLRIEGNLILKGTQDDPVVFTSFYDDEYGGDLDGDNGAILPAKGDWLGAYFLSSGQNSLIDYAIFKYGGGIPIKTDPTFPEGSPTISNTKALLSIEGTSPSISNSTFEQSQNDGIDLFSSNSNISNNIIRNNINSAISTIPSHGKIGEYSNNSGSQNGINGIVFDGDIATIDGDNIILKKMFCHMFLIIHRLMSQ